MKSTRSCSWRPVRQLRLIAITALVILGMLLPASTVGADTLGFRGEYYNNVNLTGSPVLVRTDNTVDFDWGDGAPASGVNADQFSVRWTGYLLFDAGDYAFHATSDDGVRLWVDDQLLIDQWNDHPATTYDATKYLGAGYHSVRVEHYENVGKAVCKVWWDRGGTSPSPVTDWRGEYFNNKWLGGTPAVVRNDASVSFDWGYGSPAAGIGTDNFSVRWQRTVYFGGGNYTFSATVDDGVRVYVDNALVIDKWYPQSRTTHTGTVYLGAGNHTVRVEYFEEGGVAVCMASWSGGDSGTPGAQEIIVDDRDSGFVWGGNSATWFGRSTGYRGHLYWAWNNWQTVYNWGKWYPYVSQAGTWDVYVYIPNRYHGTKSATYTIHHQGGTTNQVVNQNNYNNAWVSLGSYYFDGGSDEYVYLGNATGETYRTRFVGYDAIKFVLRGSSPGPGPVTPPSGCSITPILGFGRVWNGYSQVRTKLGCPTETEKGTWSAEQPFQGGLMFWREDIKDVYVLYNNGTWAGYDDTWVTGEPEYDPGIVPPYGYYQPVRGFGKVWRNNAPVRNGLGWATTVELGFYGSVQSYSGGMMYWSPTRGVYVMYNDGTWERYN